MQRAADAASAASVRVSSASIPEEPVDTTRFSRLRAGEQIDARTNERGSARHAPRRRAVAPACVHGGWMLHNVTSVFDELCHSDPDCKSVETQCWLRPKGQYQNHLLIFHRHSFLSRAISSFVDSIVATTPSWQCAPPLSTNFGASPLERYRCVLWLPQDLRAIRL